MNPIYILLILAMTTLGCVEQPVDVNIINEPVPTQNVVVKISDFSLDGGFLCGNSSEWVRHNYSEIILSRGPIIQTYAENGEISKAITISYPKIELNYWHIYDLQDILEEDDSCSNYLNPPDFEYHISVSIDGAELINTKKISFSFPHEYLFTTCFNSAQYQDVSDRCLQRWVDEEFADEFWRGLYNDAIRGN